MFLLNAKRCDMIIILLTQCKCLQDRTDRTVILRAEPSGAVNANVKERKHNITSALILYHHTIKANKILGLAVEISLQSVLQ